MANKKEDNLVLIKKYSNRRLYNTQTSCYITLDDVLDMVQKGEKFVVKDAKTLKDLTRQVLVQIIFDQESNSQKYNLLPDEFLFKMIKLYGMKETYDFFPNYMQIAMNYFLDNQEKMSEAANDSWNDLSPFQMLDQFTKTNLEFFEQATSFFGGKK